MLPAMQQATFRGCISQRGRCNVATLGGIWLTRMQLSRSSSTWRQDVGITWAVRDDAGLATEPLITQLLHLHMPACWGSTASTARPRKTPGVSICSCCLLEWAHGPPPTGSRLEGCTATPCRADAAGAKSAGCCRHRVAARCRTSAGVCQATSQEVLCCRLRCCPRSSRGPAGARWAHATTGALWKQGSCRWCRRGHPACSPCWCQPASCGPC